MCERMIYDNSNGYLQIKFDGDFFQITQVLDGMDTWVISVTSEELEKMSEFAKEVI